MGNPIASIGASVIGGMMSNKAAKQDRAAMAEANALNAQGYTDARPYYLDLYQRGQDALNTSMGTGAYTGDTYAGMDSRQAAGFDYLNNFANAQQNAPMGFMNQGGGFGGNYNAIYNRAAGPTLDNAMGYAQANADPLVNAAMRDSTRQLQEQTLPEIGLSASGTGNANSSRAGVAEAIAQRAYDDRRADVTTQVQNSLMDRYTSQNNNDINNMINANEGLKATYGIGFNMAPELANMYLKSGTGYQTDRQAQLDANKSQFELQRDFELDQLNKFNAGILQGAPRSVSGIQANMANPYTATMGGMMSGFGFGNKYGDALGGLFKQNAPAANQATMNLPTYGASGGKFYGVNNNVYGF